MYMELERSGLWQIKAHDSAHLHVCMNFACAFGHKGSMYLKQFKEY